MGDGGPPPHAARIGSALHVSQAISQRSNCRIITLVEHFLPRGAACLPFRVCRCSSPTLRNAQPEQNTKGARPHCRSDGGAWRARTGVRATKEEPRASGRGAGERKADAAAREPGVGSVGKRRTAHGEAVAGRQGWSRVVARGRNERADGGRMRQRGRREAVSWVDRRRHRVSAGWLAAEHAPVIRDICRERLGQE